MQFVDLPSCCVLSLQQNKFQVFSHFLLQEVKYVPHFLLSVENFPANMDAVNQHINPVFLLHEAYATAALIGLLPDNPVQSCF